MKGYLAGLVSVLLAWFVGILSKRKTVKKAKKGVIDANKKSQKRINDIDSASGVAGGFSDFVQ